MEFRVLGTLEIKGRTKDLLVPIRRKQRLVLAVLLLHANTPVCAETLIHALWADTPPASARANLQSYISDLRRLLYTDEPAGPPRLQRVHTGYLLNVGPEELDITVFERLAAEGRQALAQQRRAIAAQRLTQALAQWRGAVLQDLPLPDTLRPQAERLEQLRIATLEDHIDARIGLDEPAILVAELTELTASHPLRERLWTQLMLALYRCGRQADALQTYQRVYRLLDEELAVPPGPALQQLHHQILTSDPALNPPVSLGSPATKVTTSEPQILVPRQLPASPQMFTGRIDELATLDRIIDASTVVITAIDGMAGIGKTALALRAAYRNADHFPDGQLFIDLHGFTAGVAQVAPMDALYRLLRDVGIASDRIPAGLEERAAMWRSLLALRRMLIVLDNAATEAQVQPLLPGAAGSLVLVTSRRRLTALEATRVLSLDTLPQPDAVRLFIRTAARPELTTETPELQAEVREVVELCGRLPLAIRIAASRLKHRRAWTVAHLITQLRDVDGQLTILDDGQRSIHATLHLSYQNLSADAQRLYRLLGVHPGPDAELYAAAALMEHSLDEVGRLLDGLVDNHLLQEATLHRYRFHDLVRAHAADTATHETTPVELRVALRRLLDHYRHTAAIAMDAAYPHERQRHPTVPPASTPTPAMPEGNQAKQWLDTELPNLIAAAQHAAKHGLSEHTWHLSAVLDPHLCTHGRHQDAETLHNHALNLAHQLGNHPAEMEAHNHLARVYRMLGRYNQAGHHYERALQIAQSIGDHRGELHMLTGLGHVHQMLGRYEYASDNHGLAFQIAQAIGDRIGELNALHGLGQVHRIQGRYEQAVDHLERALQIAQSIRDRVGELNALTGLGHIHRMMGRHAQAVDHFERALQIAQTIGDRIGELGALHGLGDIRWMLGNLGEAADSYQHVLDLARQLGNSNWQFEALQGLGRLHHATGHPDLALTHHEQALQLAIDLTQAPDQARAHDGIAHARHTLNHNDLARQHWQHALDILTSLDIDQTEEIEASVCNIRSHLTNLDQQKLLISD